MADEPERKYSSEELQSEQVSKKDIISFIQEHASKSFLKEHKLNGKLNNVAKSFKKDQAISLYNKMFETKAFKSEADDEEEETVKQVTKKTAAVTVKEKPAEVAEQAPKYTKKIVKKAGKPDRIPRKGDLVSCFYTGRLQDGTVFDTNIGKGSKKKGANVPLKFKVGTGKVIRGWDEALMTMGLEEKAELTIQPEWAYGKKGVPDSKIPPNAVLIFEVELVGIE